MRRDRFDPGPAVGLVLVLLPWLVVVIVAVVMRWCT